MRYRTFSGIPLAYPMGGEPLRLDRSVGPYDLLVPRLASDPSIGTNRPAALGVNLDIGRLATGRELSPSVVPIRSSRRR